MTLVVFLTYGVSLRDWEKIGLLTREMKLYESLVAKGWQISFVTYGNEDDHAVISSFKGMNALPLFEGAKYPKNKFLRKIKALMRLNTISQNIPGDAILKCKQMYGAWMPALLGLLTGRPFVFRYGFDDIHFRSELNQSAIMTSLFKRITLWSLKKARHIIVTTKNDYNRLTTYISTQDIPVTILPNWVDTEIFKQHSEKRLTNRLLFVGRMNAQKNLTNLIKALKGSGLGLDIYGMGSLETVLSDVAKTHEVDLKIHAPVANAALPTIFNRYQYFCLPSHFEGNPKVLLEAMACGTIVIGTAVEGIVELITQHQNGILVRPDLSDLKEAIAEVNADKTIQQLIVQRAIQYIDTHHRLDELATREHELLTQLKP